MLACFFSAGGLGGYIFLNSDSLYRGEIQRRSRRKRKARWEGGREGGAPRESRRLLVTLSRAPYGSIGESFELVSLPSRHSPSQAWNTGSSANSIESCVPEYLKSLCHSPWLMGSYCCIFRHGTLSPCWTSKLELRNSTLSLLPSTSAMLN